MPLPNSEESKEEDGIEKARFELDLRFFSLRTLVLAAALFSALLILEASASLPAKSSATYS